MLVSVESLKAFLYSALQALHIGAINGPLPTNAKQSPRTSSGISWIVLVVIVVVVVVIVAVVVVNSSLIADAGTSGGSETRCLFSADESFPRFKYLTIRLLERSVVDIMCCEY